MVSRSLRVPMRDKSSYVAALPRAERVRRDWRSDVRSTARIDLTVEAFSARHMVKLESERNRSLKSWRTWHHAFCADFAGLDLRALTVSVWEAWLRARRLDRPRLAEKTLKARLSLASSAYAFAAEIGAVDDNPIPKIARSLRPRPPRDRSHQRLGVLSVADIRLVLGLERRPAAWWEHWGYAGLVLTGGRFGEWAAASYGALKRDLSPLPGVVFDRAWDTYLREVVPHTKDGATKFVPLHMKLAPMLDELPGRFREQTGRDIQATDPLWPFFSERGDTSEVRRWNQRTALRRWKDFLDTIGVPPTASGTRNLHHARHTLITRLRRAKANPLAVRALTHPLTVEAHGDSHGLYAHDLDWSSLCEAVMCLDLDDVTDDAYAEPQLAFAWGDE